MGRYARDPHSNPLDLNARMFCVSPLLPLCSIVLSYGDVFSSNFARAICDGSIFVSA